MQYPRAAHYLTIAVLFAAMSSAFAKTHTESQSSWHSAAKHSTHVNCDRGQSLSKAVRRARSGATIVVRGTCYDQVLIKRDFIRLRGVDGAVVDGSIGNIRHPVTITVRGARGVVIRDLHIQNGPDQGIVVEAASSVKIKNVTTTGHTTVGVTVDGSYAELENVKATENGAGYDFFTGATVIARGTIEAHSNLGPGVSVNGDTTLELRGAIIEAVGNGGDGVLAVNNANILILSFPEAQGSGFHLRANRGNAGMFVANSNISIVGSQFFGSGANNFVISEHASPGMLLISSNLASPFATATFELSANGVGMVLTDNTDVIIAGGLQVTENNGPGVVADGAGVVRLQQNEANPSALGGNRGPDIVATFGSRLAVDPGIANFVICDATVLTPAGGCS